MNLAKSLTCVLIILLMYSYSVVWLYEPWWLYDYSSKSKWLCEPWWLYIVAKANEHPPTLHAQIILGGVWCGKEKSQFCLLLFLAKHMYCM